MLRAAAEKLTLYDRERFLRLILYRPDNIRADDQQEVARLPPSFEILFAACLKHYSADELKLVMKERLKNIRFYDTNLFMTFMKKRLSLV